MEGTGANKEMKFFLPPTDDPKIAEATYLVIRRFVEKDYGPLSDSRYYSVKFMRDGKLCSATVGATEPSNSETVIAIFKQANGILYYICTPS